MTPAQPSGHRRSGIPLSILVPALAALVLLWFFRTALAPFFLAAVLAYLLQPLSTRLSRRIPRGWAALLAILVFLLVVALMVWALVPALVSQVDRLLASLPVIREKALVRWTPWLNAHPGIQAKVQQGLSGVDPWAVLDHLRVAGAGLVGWLLELTTLILVPIIAYYLLVEGPRLTRGLDDLVPERFRPRVREVSGEINQRLGGYVRGQLAVAAVMSLLQGTGFQLVGVPYAWLLGTLAGISNVVPYSPYVTSLPLALLFSAINGHGGLHLLLVVLVFVLVQKTEAFYFTPVWVGRATGLHPLEVLLAIFIFGFAFGVVGLIFSVPLMIACTSVARPLLAAYKQHPWYVGRPRP